MVDLLEEALKNADPLNEDFFFREFAQRLADPNEETAQSIGEVLRAVPQTLPLLMHVLAATNMADGVAEVVKQLDLGERDLVAYLPTSRLVETGIVDQQTHKFWLRLRQEQVYTRRIANLGAESPRAITQLLYTFLETVWEPEKAPSVENIREIIVDGKVDMIRALSLLAEVVGEVQTPDPLRIVLVELAKTPEIVAQVLQIGLSTADHWKPSVRAAAYFVHWKMLGLEQALALMPDFADFESTWRPGKPTRTALFVLQCLELDLEDQVMPVLRQFPSIVQAEPKIARHLSLQVVDLLAAEHFDFEAVEEKLALAGPLVGECPQVIVRLCELANEPRDDWTPFWTRMLAAVLLPGLSLVSDYPEAVVSVWNVLEKLPFRERYNLYSEWRAAGTRGANSTAVGLAGQTTLAHAFDNATKEAKSALKRLSRTNADEIMPRLARVAEYNPLAALSVTLVQLESYDFLRHLVAKHAGLFTRLAWDMLPLLLLERFALPRTSRHADGMQDRQWVQSLAELSAQLALEFTEFDVRPFVNYSLKRLEAGGDTQLVILRNLLARLGGQPVVKTASRTQLEILAGPEPLRRLVLPQLGKECAEPPQPERLVDAITALGVADRLLYALAAALARAQNPGIDATPAVKVMSYTVDEITQVLGQYVGLLSAEHTDTLLPLAELATNMPLSQAFAARRKSLNRQVYVSGPATDAAVEPALAEYSTLAPSTLPPGLFLSFWVMGPYEVFYSDEVYAEQVKQSPEAETELKQVQLRHRFHVTRWATSLRQQSAYWFESGDNSAEEFLHHCLLPRMTMSPLDAWYSAQFVMRLFRMSPPNWSVLALFEALFSHAPFQVLGIATNYESDSMAVLYREILHGLSSWASNEQAYTTAMALESEGLNGSMAESEPFGGAGQPISLEDFRNRLGRWHSSLTAVIMALLQSEEPVTQRNTISLCFNVIGDYPLIKSHGHALLSEMNRLFTTSGSEDIRLAARSLLGLLYKRKDGWHSSIGEYFDDLATDKTKELSLEPGFPELDEMDMGEDMGEMNESDVDEVVEELEDPDEMDEERLSESAGLESSGPEQGRSSNLDKRRQNWKDRKKERQREGDRNDSKDSKREKQLDHLPDRPLDRDLNRGRNRDTRDTRDARDARDARDGNRDRGRDRGNRDKNRDRDRRDARDANRDGNRDGNRRDRDRDRDRGRDNDNRDRGRDNDNRDRGRDNESRHRGRENDNRNEQDRNRDGNRRSGNRKGRNWREYRELKRERERSDGDREQDSKRRRRDDRSYR